MSLLKKVNGAVVGIFLTMAGVGLAGAAPTLTVTSPLDSASIDTDNVLVTGMATTAAGQGVDVVLVLDNSGSLSATDPTKERFEAVRQLLNSYGPDADINIGVIFFDDSAEVAVSLRALSTARMNILLNLASHSTPSGGTAIGDAIAAASAELSTNGRTGSSHVIVLFSDGQNGSGSDPVSAAQAAAADSVVNVVGLGSDSSFSSEMQSIATAGGGDFLSASQPSQLISLFSSATTVGIASVGIENTTSGLTVPLVSITSGSFSGSVDLQDGDNIISVTATDTSGMTTTSQVTVNRTSTTPPPVAERRTKLRPQVLMAGFDPMLLDITDTSFRVVSLVREGTNSINSVSVEENTGSFSIGMTNDGSISNGDQVYSLGYTFTRGSIPMGTPLANFFGSAEGEYKVSVTDSAYSTHSFPSLEYGNNMDVTVPALAATASYTTSGAKRNKPQAIMVGFDPILLDYADTSFDVKAMVRAGTLPVQGVSLKNGGGFAMAMTKDSDLANGDEMYKVTYVFSRGSFPSGSFRDLFGNAFEGEFVVEVTDTAQQTHQFPALEVGNYGNYPAM